MEEAFESGQCVQKGIGQRVASFANKEAACFPLRWSNNSRATASGGQQRGRAKRDHRAREKCGRGRECEMRKLPSEVIRVDYLTHRCKHQSSTAGAVRHTVPTHEAVQAHVRFPSVQQQLTIK